MSVVCPSPTIIPLAQLCRGCMGEMEPVTGTLSEDERLKMLQLFKLCTEIEVEESEMPQQFCRDCEGLLTSLSTFIKTAKIVNNILLRLIRRDQKSAPVNNSKPNICLQKPSASNPHKIIINDIHKPKHIFGVSRNGVRLGTARYYYNSQTNKYIQIAGTQIIDNNLRTQNGFKQQNGLHHQSNLNEKLNSNTKSQIPNNNSLGKVNPIGGKSLSLEKKIQQNHKPYTEQNLHVKPDQRKSQKNLENEEPSSNMNDKSHYQITNSEQTALPGSNIKPAPLKSKSNLEDITCLSVSDDDDLPPTQYHHTLLSEPNPTRKLISFEEILGKPCDPLDSSTQQPTAITDMNCKSDNNNVAKSPRVDVSEETRINLKDNITQPIGTEQSNEQFDIPFKQCLLPSEIISKFSQYQSSKSKPIYKIRINAKPDQHGKSKITEQVEILENKNTEHVDKDEHQELDDVKLDQHGKHKVIEDPLIHKNKENVVIDKHQELNERSEVLTDHDYTSPGRHIVTCTQTCRCHLCCYIKVPADGERMFKCTHCPKSFHFNFEIRTHIRNVHPIERFQCAHCHLTYKLKNTLKNHLMEKHDDKFVPKFACDKCGKRYRLKSALKRHQMFHLENHKHFLCFLCGHKCSTRGNLKTHLSHSHSDEKPFECNDCGYRGKTKSSLARHLKKLHCKRTKQMVCHHCGKDFFDSHGLKMHMIRHIEPRIQCPVCSQRFYEKTKCRRHLQTKHKHMPDMLPSIVSRVINDTYCSESDPLA